MDIEDDTVYIWKGLEFEDGNTKEFIDKVILTYWGQKNKDVLIVEEL